MNTGPSLDRLASELSGWLAGNDIRRLPVMPRSAEALIVWALHRSPPRTVVWVADGPRTLEAMHRDLVCLAPTPEADGLLYFPARETSLTPRGARKKRGARGDDAELAGYRLRALQALAGANTTTAQPPQPAWLVATCVQALMQPTTERMAFSRDTIRLAVGDEHDPDALAGRLAASGYAFEPEVTERAAASRKGGLLDVWPPDQPGPLRVEFFGSRVESIREFDPGTQVSVRRVTEVVLLPANEGAATSSDVGTVGGLISFLPADAVFVWSDPRAVGEHAAACEEAAAAAAGDESIVTFADLRRRIGGRTGAEQIAVRVEQEDGAGALPLSFQAVTGVAHVAGDVFLPDVMETARRKVVDGLIARARAGLAVHVFLETDGAAEHFRQMTAESAGGGRSLRIERGSLSEGFLCEGLGLVVVAESDLYGVRKQHHGRYTPGRSRAWREEASGDRLTDVSGLEPGDLVVHAEHGIGRYQGLSEVVFGGEKQEVVTIEYADEAKLHVPMSQMPLLSRYTGVSRHSVALHRLGGSRWNREKGEAETAIADMAASLLETQGRREALAGHAFGPDVPWQREFEASFPYRETPDQARAIGEVKRQMETPRSMDLLVCGDAGYGKTEVAMRAAFKAVMDGKQVAVLTPTTVLAQQHFDTFTERMAAYPIRIAMLSRFCGAGGRREVIAEAAEGKVDIVIGTHALLQPNVHFRDLALVIVDEEQRFGVRHKEWLKQLRAQVDVLTMSATPIPRTLYLSMTGVRDMTLIQTPPRDRTPVETFVAKNEDGVVRAAILRELNREGQVFYLHNRVLTIERVRERLQRLAPNARIAVAHGQMAAGQLAAVVRRFVAGESDVLLCTTIIESGTDIPRANTILIDRADRFGLADLYQLRGRVGRSTLKGYAYLLLPPHGPVDPVARKRLDAIVKHAEPGAGFTLAMRDLEIRGAGNLLGPQQSGYINAIGFGLYCQLLRRTVGRLKGKPAQPLADADLRLDFISLSAEAADADRAAAIPYDYIEDERIRLGLYRRVAEAGERATLKALREELADRFGPVPPALDRFLKMAELRVVCAETGIRQVETRDGKVLFTTAAGLLMAGARFPRLTAPTPTGRLDELIRMAASSRRWGRATGE